MHLADIETASLKGWPALEERIYDGWILRFSEGYTKRANSVNPIHRSTIDLDKKVTHCENFYQENNLPSIFRITPFVSPRNLDSFLEARGYEKIDPTWVLTLDIIELEIPPLPHGELQSIYLEQWLDTFCNIRGDSVEDHQAHRKILKAIPPPKLFATLLHEDQHVACCVGSLVDRKFGMFDLITNPVLRRRGFGTSLVLNMLGWAKKRGAALAYLQVVMRNKAAFSLYSSLGFEKTYSYWYRKIGISD